ncbi:uncharacterized protein LOC128299551 [Anopheles moucheti]|uniref:uncharacterized protein LOC128299551 n=1 Tax=Anopheles moucheti TaxID=186751 RepID=UPI0022EFE9B9|nr:uncharacterized protein LOC128299551 [Anopheles moucheti]
MSTASEKEQYPEPSATACGTRSFRRRKIVPTVVAKKIANNNTKNTAKIVSSKENAKNVPNNEETSAGMKEASETEPQSEQPREAPADVALPKPILQAEESKGVKMPDAQKDNATFKPAAAFRRIKPKVVIPQTQKPAKSILKNSTTPVKGSVNNAESSNETSPRQDPEFSLHPDEATTADDHPMQKPVCEESEKWKQHAEPEPIQTTRKKENDSELCKTDAAVVSSTTDDVAKGEEVKECLDVQNATALEAKQLSSSLTTNVTPVSIPTTQDTTRQHSSDALTKPECTPSNASAVTKTIKRTISLGTLTPAIANLLKKSLGKKASKGTKALPPANDKPVNVSQQSNPSQQQTSESLIANAAQANQTESDKPSTDSTVSGSTAEHLLPPVLENPVDDMVSKETTTITKAAPSPVKSQPTPPKLPDGGPVSGIKKIQKVHQLTAEQQRLVLNSLKKGKGKRSAKMPDAASVTPGSIVVASHGSIESIPNVPVSSVPKDDPRVNIISNIILPRLTVGTQQNTLSASDGPVAVPITSNCSSSTAVPTSPAQQLTRFVTQISPTATVPSNNSNQYPKLFICHKPAATAAPFPISVDPAEARQQLIQPTVSVTVLSKTNHTMPGYPSLGHSVPTRPYMLPIPVVTVRPTSPKTYGNSSPAALPKPIVSVTVSPMNSSNSTANTMNVPVDPRIVPKIVITHDTADHDSQSSLASTSSSSSSGQNTPAPKKQTDDRPLVLSTAKDHAPTETSCCSPSTRDKLRAKSLQNLWRKNEGKSGMEYTSMYPYYSPHVQQSNTGMQMSMGNDDTEVSRTYVQQLNLQKENNEAYPRHLSIMERVKQSLPKMETTKSTTIEPTPSVVSQRAADNHVPLKAPTVSDYVPQPVKCCVRASVPENNEFLGFSALSIECEERDFQNRVRTIDFVLEEQRKSCAKGAINNEEAIEKIETNATTTQESKRISTPPASIAEVTEKLGEESVAKTDATICATLDTVANDQNRTDSTDEAHANVKSADTNPSSFRDESGIFTRKIEEPQAELLQNDDVAVKNVPMQLSAPSETVLKESAIAEEIDKEQEMHSEVAENENPTGREEPNAQQESVATRSDEVLEEVPDVAASDGTSEAENTLDPEPETMMKEGEDPDIPVPDLIDKTATGVDIIMAMAKLRRENRVLSLDDVSDRELSGWMEQPIGTGTNPTLPSTSAGQLTGKKSRKRRKKKRKDKFVQLLLKHVNYDALIEDLVQQEKRRYNYKSSSDEEERTISPLQRYIREREREQPVAIVEYDNPVSSPAISSEDDESLVEETILSRILNKRSYATAATTSFCATDRPVDNLAECSNTPQKAICSGSTTSHDVPDDQRDDVQRTSICDTAAENDAAEIKKAQPLRGFSDVEMVLIDPLPQRADVCSGQRNKSCDISETNAAICDTPSDTVVEKASIEANPSPSKVIETSNTQAQFQRRTRSTGLKRVRSSRKRPARRLANKVVPCTNKRKRPNYLMTAPPRPVEMPLFDSSDASNNDEVVSDCSSGGLSTGEAVANSSTRKTLPARKCNANTGNVLPGVTSATLTRSGRSRNNGRRQSSSSNSISSSTRNHSLSCDGDLSSSDDTKPDRRRTLRRKRRPVRYGMSGNRAPVKKGTVDCDTKRSMSATTSSKTSNIRSHLPTVSKPSKASNLDAQYVITEGASESAKAPPRVLDVINVRNNRVLSSTARATRTTKIPPEPPEVPGKDGPKSDEPNRSAKSNQTGDTISEGFITPASITEQSSTANEKDPAAQSQSDGGPVSSEPMDGTTEFDNQIVKCGNCGKEMLQSGWQEHCTVHNGATFRDGIDFAFDMKDLKAVSTAIARFMKLNRRAEVACERCGTVKKSGLGMASHMNQCGLSAQELEQSKASCSHCGRKMKAVSLLAHQQLHCRVIKEQKRQIALTIPSEEEIAISKETTTASGRKKRKSVASAERKIKTMAKEINEELNVELVLEIYGRGVSSAIMQCWMSHLKQSSEAVCAYVGCPFFGMTSEHMRTEYSDVGTNPKPLYQCAKCAYMATAQKPIYDHLAVVHPQTLRRVAEEQRSYSSCASDADSDVFMASGASGADDTYSSSALEDEDEGGKSKKGKGRKQTGGSNKSKAKKNSENPKGNSKKSAAKQTVNRAISSELMDSTMTTGGTEETEVYKEMVLQESIELKQGKGNFHLTTVSWMQEYRREHYAAPLLFCELRPDVDTSYLRSITNVRDYLPKATHSMRYVQCNSKEYEPSYEPEMFANRWQQKNTFDGEALGCESMFYCGGPVVSLDWLPLPDDCENDCDQYLAVACKHSYDEYYNGEELAVPRSSKCLVQIWNVGPIQNLGSTKVTLRCPRLAFAIACDYGPIWQVAFCPSGCYNDPAQGDVMDRLGLLAVAGSDGDVHLYALSRSMVGAETSTTPRILHLRPVLLLSLTMAAAPQDQPAADFTGRSVVRIAWTREKGHNVLAAGYSNGVVAVWNLAATSPLLCGKKHGIRTLLPVHKILHSSSGCITAMDLHYSTGSRYLVVCNADRRMKVYDLRSSLYQPQESLSMVMRSRVSSIRWLLHFPVLVIAYDDALYIDRCAYSTHQPRDIGLRMFSIFTVGTEMTDLGTNDWCSMNAVATSGGDLVCHRPVPFVYGMNYKKLAQILTTTIPMKINAIDDSADVSRYKVFSEEYGLLFSDTDKVPTAMDTAALHLKTWRRAKFSHYPAVRLNQIRWNPNSFSYTYYAIGYQAGFVRVRVLRS